MSLLEEINRGREAEKSGAVVQAEQIYLAILAEYPEQPDTLYRLGLMASDAGKHEEGLRFIYRAIAAVPNPLDVYYFNAARLHYILKQPLEALAAYEKVIGVNPSYAEAYINRGIILHGMRRYDEAFNNFQKAAAIAPHHAATYYGLGNVLRDVGKREDAIHAFEKALSLIGNDDHNLRGMIHNNIGIIFLEVAAYTLAEGHFKQATIFAPNTAIYFQNYGITLRNQGRQQEALAALKRALEIDPFYAEARWAYTMFHVPLLFDNYENVQPARRAFLEQLHDLDRWFDVSRIDLGHIAVGTGQPFFIAYQEENNRELLMKYGSICARVMKQWADKTRIIPKSLPTLPVVRILPRITIGIVSAHFFDHSVWRALIKGWLLYFDPEQIEIHLFNTGTHVDSETEWAKNHSASFEFITRNLEESVQRILDKHLDILIYPDVGMDPLVIKLASLRLCPLQMVAWGHPETSGLPTIDYYISAEAYEPPEADHYYSEKLIRLPHLGCCYQPIDAATIAVIPDLEKLGIKKDRPLLVSPGLSFKYAPQHDHVFVDIARKLGACQIVFFYTHNTLSGKLEARLKKAFEKEGLNFNDFCIFIPTQNKKNFLGLFNLADIFLDTIGFSGFNTCIQAIECGLPVVTYEGRFMRGRLASGILQYMGLTELVTANDSKYVDKVVELVKNPQYQAYIRKEICDRRSILFNDRVPVDALQKLLMSLVLKSSHTTMK